MFKPQSTVCITQKREPELMNRINQLGNLKNLKPSIALRILLDKHLPKNTRPIKNV